MNDFLDVFTRLQRYISAKLLHVRANYSYNIGAVTNRIIFRKNRGIFFHPPSVEAFGCRTVRLVRKSLNNEVGSPFVKISAY